MRAWGPAAAWAAVLFLLSARPNPSVPLWLASYDKVVHAGLYAILGLALAYGRHRTSSPSHVALIFLGALYGATDEWHQAFVPGRTPDWRDWLADVAGVVLGYGLALLFLRRLARRASPTTTIYGVDVSK